MKIFKKSHFVAQRIKERVKKRLCLYKILREMLIKDFMKRKKDITFYMNSNYLRKD